MFKVGDEVVYDTTEGIEWGDGSPASKNWARSDGCVFGETYIVTSVSIWGDITLEGVHLGLHDYIPAEYFHLAATTKVKDLTADEVMKAHRLGGGELVRRPWDQSQQWTPCTSFMSRNHWDWTHYEYGIVDDSKPEIDWDGFDWEFFNQYGMLRVDAGGNGARIGKVEDVDYLDADVELVESPFYPWSGGRCPVPSNVDVEIEAVECETNCQYGNMERIREIVMAGDVDWTSINLVAFRLTGMVL